MSLKIVSGGQTGVDRAALDVALQFGLPCGGWCPLGRRAEDGPIPARYPLQETPSAAYPVRTLWNVRDADATLILTRGKPDRGTALTCDIARDLGKPLLIVDLNGPVSCNVIRQWMASNTVVVLNVAGPRESSQPGIQAQAADILQQLLNRRKRRLRSSISSRSRKE